MPQWLLPLFVAGKSEHGSGTLKSFSSRLRNPIQCARLIFQTKNLERITRAHSLSACLPHIQIYMYSTLYNAAAAFFFSHFKRNYIFLYEAKHNEHKLLLLYMPV